MKTFLKVSFLIFSLLTHAELGAYTIDCGNDQPNPPKCPDSTGANPIKPGRADLHREVTDITTYGDAPIAFTRTYNSRTTSFNSPYFDLGEGQTWQHNWNCEVRQLTSKTFGFFDIKVRYPDGNEYTFKATDSSGAQLAAAADWGDRLYRWSGSIVGYTMVKPNGEQWDFKRVSSPKFRLQQVRNGTGLYWDIGYDSNGKINLIVNCFGRWLQIDRSTFGGVECISKVSTSDGRDVDFDYSAWSPTSSQVLTKVTYPDATEAHYTYVGGTTTAPDAGRPLLATADDPCYSGAGSRTHYVYNYGAVFNFGAGPYLVTGTLLEERNGVTDQLIVSLPLGSGTVPKVLDGTGNEIGFVYDKGLLIKKTDEEGRETDFTYDQSGYGHLSSVTGPNGGTTAYVRDFAGRITSKTDAMGNTSSATYNSYGFEVSRTDELGGTVTTTRNSSNQVTRIDYPDGSYETMTNNLFGQVLTHRLTNGSTETRVYYVTGESGGLPGDLKTFTNGAGAVSHYTWTDAGLPASMTNTAGFTTVFSYNWRGLLEQETYPDSSFKSYAHDTYGNLTQDTDELGHSQVYTYDEYNYLRTKEDALGRITAFEYGLTPGCATCTFNPTVRKVTFPSGKVVEYSYDETQRLTQIKEAPGTADEAITTRTYNADGDLATITDANGHTTTYAEDLMHRKTSETNALGQTIQWTYDAAGNNLTITRPDTGVVTNTYDSMSRMLTSENGNGETTTFTYNSGGCVATMVDAKGATYSFLYDGINRKSKVTYPDATYEEWTFDDTAGVSQPYVMQRFRNAETLFKVADSRMRDTSWVYSDATPDTSFSYDLAGRLVTASNSVSGHAFTYSDADELTTDTTTMGALTPFVLTYTYNSDGQRDSVTYPDGTVVATTYTERRQIKEIKQSGITVASYGYFDDGNRRSKVLINGITSDYAYDNANRLLQIKHKLGSSVVGQVDYVNSPVGNPTQKQITGLVPNRTEDYTYDLNDQVTVSDYGTHSSTFAYDGAGNRSSLIDTALGTTTYVTNADNQYTSINSQALTYDANGNLKTHLGWTYTYDSQSRLTGATDGTNTASIGWDYRGRQVARSVNGATTYLIYDGPSLIAEYYSSGTLGQRYVMGGSIDEVVSKESSGATVYYLQDSLNSTVALTDSFGSLLESYNYSVFGEPIVYNASGSTIGASAYDNRLMFTGREYMKELGLYDYRNRMYSADLGRFLQLDPIRFEADDANLYRYVGNGPARKVDPTGLCAEGPHTRSLDDVGTAAAKEAFNEMRKNGNIEYCGLICEGCENGQKVRTYTKPHPGTPPTSSGARGQCAPAGGAGCDPGYKRVGSYHSHPSNGEIDGKDKNVARGIPPGADGMEYVARAGSIGGDGPCAQVDRFDPGASGSGVTTVWRNPSRK